MRKSIMIATMKMFCFYLIPLFSILTTLLSCFLLFKLSTRSHKWRSLFFDVCGEFIAESVPLKDLADQQFDKGVAPLRHLLEQRYDGFIEALKKRIPMAEFVMQGSLASQLKEQVQNEIASLLPELKERLTEHLLTQEEMRDWVKSYLKTRSSINLDSFFDKLKRQFLWKTLAFLTAISFIFGLLQLLFFLYVC